MVVRIVQFLLGAILAGGGGYLGWLNRGLAVSLFPADAGTAPWLLIGALLAVCAGAVLLVASVLPQGARKAQIGAEMARREESLQAADTFYGERSRAADRDWRSGDLPPEPAAKSEPVAAKPAPAAPPKATPAASGPFPAAAAVAPIPVAADPPLQPLPASTPPPAPVAAPAELKLAEPKPAPAAAPAPEPLAKAARAPIATPAPAPVTPAPLASIPAAAVVGQVASGNGPFASIRDAISSNRLDEADKLLADERARAGTDGATLAALTGLAGDHAAAAGRPGNAKWLWRLALKRFADAGEINSRAARDVSERLRLIDQ